MSLTLVISAWIVMLGTLAALKARQHGVVTSVSRFHRQLVVLGRTSSSQYTLSHFEHTESFFVAKTQLANFGTRPAHSAAPQHYYSKPPNKSAVMSQTKIQQRRSIVLFSLLVTLLTASFITILSASMFALTLTVFLLISLTFYVLALIRIRIVRQNKLSTKRQIPNQVFTSRQNIASPHQLNVPRAQHFIQGTTNGRSAVLHSN